MVLRVGMLSAASAVASSMLFSCSSQVCGQQGFDVVAGTETITSVGASDVACQGVTPPCVAQGDAGACATYYVLPIASGNCHVDVALATGTTFSTDVKIDRGPSGCAGFYPAVAADAIIEAP